MYEIYERLLQERGVNSAQVSKATGISQSTLSEWKKNNSKLRIDKLQKIADFFGVTVDYLMTGGAEERTSTSGKVYYFDDETARTAQELMENPDLRLLFDAAQDSSSDVLHLAADMLKKFKETNPNG